MNNPITLEGLAVIDAIDRRGSFAAAADSLNKVPSAVSYTVSKLEHELDVRLFAKQGRRAVLTPAGQLLLTQGRELLQAADALAERTREADKGWEPRLRIAVDSLVHCSELLALISRFYQLNQFTELDLREEVLGGAWEAVAMNRADLAIGAPEISRPPAELKSRYWRAVHWVFAVAPHHPLAEQRLPLSDDRIAQYRSVLVRDSSIAWAPLSHRVINDKAALRVGSINEKIAAQVAGLGVGFLPKERIESELANKTLIALETQDCPEPSRLMIVRQKQGRGRALRWFEAALCE